MSWLRSCFSRVFSVNAHRSEKWGLPLVGQVQLHRDWYLTLDPNTEEAKRLLKKIKAKFDALNREGNILDILGAGSREFILAHIWERFTYGISHPLAADRYQEMVVDFLSRSFPKLAFAENGLKKARILALVCEHGADDDARSQAADMLRETIKAVEQTEGLKAAQTIASQISFLKDPDSPVRLALRPLYDDWRTKGPVDRIQNAL